MSHSLGRRSAQLLGCLGPPPLAPSTGPCSPRLRRGGRGAFPTGIPGDKVHLRLVDRAVLVQGVSARAQEGAGGIPGAS